MMESEASARYEKEVTVTARDPATGNTVTLTRRGGQYESGMDERSLMRQAQEALFTTRPKPDEDED